MMKTKDVTEDSGPAVDSAQRTKGVESARRALQILLQFSEGRPELTIDDLLEQYDISVPSAYRYLSLLREMNFIEERAKGSFVLSPLMLQLARTAEQTLDYREEAQPVLDRIRDETGESALYLRRVNDAAVCLAISESDHPIAISFQLGHLMPLHGGASAKILLAEYSASKRSQYLNRVIPAMSSSTREQLQADLVEIRRTGYAESNSEVDAGVWASAAAVRAHGALVGAITVAAPAYRLDEEHKRRIGASVRAGAAAFEAAIAR